MTKPRIAIVSSLNFPGGTATAIAEELSVLSQFGEVVFYNANVKMLRKQPINQTLFNALRRYGGKIADAVGTVAADIVIIHNPALFKFEDELDFRMIAKKVFVVMHENPINAFHDATFQYDKTLNMLHKASITPEFVIAPISGVNRNLIVEAGIQFTLAKNDWFNIWSEEPLAPNHRPQDRRGRHSRPGVEKWSKLHDFKKCFPDHAENHILGAIPIMKKPEFAKQNTYLYDFGSMLVPRFLNLFDFYVYFHSPAWRESYGRCVAEAVSAGKFVITHKYMEQTFGESCVYCSVDEVDNIIAHYIDHPAEYLQKINNAQRNLRERYSPEAFINSWGDMLAAA